MAKKGLLAAIAEFAGGEAGRLWIQNGCCTSAYQLAAA